MTTVIKVPNEYDRADANTFKGMFMLLSGAFGTAFTLASVLFGLVWWYSSIWIFAIPCMVFTIMSVVAWWGVIEAHKIRYEG